jgi:hypothetical protein
LAESALSIDRPLSNQVLLSFPKRSFGSTAPLGFSAGFLSSDSTHDHREDREDRQGRPERSITFGMASTSILVLGGTGEGKTASVGIPALYRLHEAGCPGLVLDIVKQDYAALCRRLDRVFVVGDAEDSDPVNLIAGWSEHKLKDLLLSFSTMGTRPDHDNAYWGTQGVEDALLVVEMVRAFMEREPTLADIHDYLSSPKRFVGTFEAMKIAYTLTASKLDPESPLSRLKESATRRYEERANGAYCFSIIHCGASEPSAEAMQQYSWHTAKLLACLRPLAAEPELRHKLCSETAQAIDWPRLLYRERRLVVLDMPEARFGSTALLVSKLLRGQFRDCVKSAHEARLAGGYGRGDAYTFMLIDEYQRYVSAGGDPGSDDNLWLDISRSLGHINVLCTQSLTSIIACSGNREAVHTIVQNCRNWVALPSADQETVKHLAFLAGPGYGEYVERWAISPSSRHTAFVWTAASADSEEGASKTTAAGPSRGEQALRDFHESPASLCLLQGSVHAHMDHRLGPTLLAKPALRARSMEGGTPVDGTVAKAVSARAADATMSGPSRSDEPKAAACEGNTGVSKLPDSDLLRALDEKFNNDLFIKAVLEEDVAMIQWCIDQIKEVKNSMFPAETCIRKNLLKSLKVLLDNGLEPDYEGPGFNERPPLGLLAVRLKRYDALELLLSYGASMKPFGRNMATEAARLGDVRTLRILHDHGLDLMKRDDQGMNALQVASKPRRSGLSDDEFIELQKACKVFVKELERMIERGA